MIIADRLKQRRLQYGREAGLEDGYTQEAVAAACEIGQSHYSRCESNNERLPFHRIAMLAEFYGKPIAEAFPEFRPTTKERQLIEAVRRV